MSVLLLTVLSLYCTVGGIRLFFLTFYFPLCLHSFWEPDKGIKKNTFLDGTTMWEGGEGFKSRFYGAKSYTIKVK